MTWIFLSYELNEGTPSYGKGSMMQIQQGKRMADGDSCNTQEWCISNHLGTHIDAPRHFSEDGNTIDQYPPQFWMFSNPCLVDISPVSSGQIVGCDQIQTSEIPSDTDLLLIKTGFGLYRDSDEYSLNNPGLAPDLADFLRERLPSLRVVGLDSVSISSYTDRESGRDAHRRFLHHDRPILLLEDMDLSALGKTESLMEVLILPLRVTKADASPCTVIARIS
jgi:kynurenine formamidase